MKKTQKTTKKPFPKTPPKGEAIPLGTPARRGKAPAHKPLMPPPPSSKPAPKKAKGKMQGRPVAVPQAKPTTSAQPLLDLEPETDGALQPQGTYQEHPLLADLPELVAKQQALKAELKGMKAKEAEEKELREEIEALLLAAGVESVTCGDVTVARIEVEGRRTISQDALLALGVEADTIAAATETGEGYSYVSVKETK